MDFDPKRHNSAWPLPEALTQKRHEAAVPKTGKQSSSKRMNIPQGSTSQVSVDALSSSAWRYEGGPYSAVNGALRNDGSPPNSAGTFAQTATLVSQSSWQSFDFGFAPSPPRDFVMPVAPQATAYASLAVHQSAAYTSTAVQQPTHYAFAAAQQPTAYGINGLRQASERGLQPRPGQVRPDKQNTTLNSSSQNSSQNSSQRSRQSSGQNSSQKTRPQLPWEAYPVRPALPGLPIGAANGSSDGGRGPQSVSRNPGYAAAVPGFFASPSLQARTARNAAPLPATRQPHTKAPSGRFIRAAPAPTAEPLPQIVNVTSDDMTQVASRQRAEIDLRYVEQLRLASTHGTRREVRALAYALGIGIDVYTVEGGKGGLRLKERCNSEAYYIKGGFLNESKRYCLVESPSDEGSTKNASPKHCFYFALKINPPPLARTFYYDRFDFIPITRDANSLFEAISRRFIGTTHRQMRDLACAAIRPGSTKKDLQDFLPALPAKEKISWVRRKLQKNRPVKR